MISSIAKNPLAILHKKSIKKVAFEKEKVSTRESIDNLRRISHDFNFNGVIINYSCQFKLVEFVNKQIKEKYCEFKSD